MKFISYAIPEDELAALRSKGVARKGNEIRGAGDVIERLAHPIAVAIKSKCLDANGNLKPKSPCGKGRTFLNKVLPNPLRKVND